MRIHITVITILILSLSQLSAAQPSTAQNKSPSGVSFGESGKDSKGTQLYGLVANGQGIAEILRKIFTSTGDTYVIDEDVVGTVDISVRSATLEQILRHVSEAARPPLRIRRDEKGLYKVSREAPASPVGFNLAPGTVPGIVPNALQGGYAAMAAGNRPVTLSIPKERPIPLADALAQISAQTNYRISLDRRIPRDVEFSGNITRAPLSLVLQYISETAKLKLIADANSASFTAPDWLILRVRDVILGTTPSTTCLGCGEKISSDWRYCPNCSRITPTGSNDLKGRGVPPKRGGKMGKIGGF